MAITLKSTLAPLESLGNGKVRTHNKKNGSANNQFGVRIGDIRKLAAKIKNNDPPMTELWATENVDEEPWPTRAGWSLTSERIAKNPEGLDLSLLLDRIEAEMATALSEVQWTMNFYLAGIGIRFPKLRKRAVAIGEKLGIYRDYPVSKGCTLPFAPIWINEMVRRQAVS